jgi:hypothetical protein
LLPCAETFITLFPVLQYGVHISANFIVTLYCPGAKSNLYSSPPEYTNDSCLYRSGSLVPVIVVRLGSGPFGLAPTFPHVLPLPYGWSASHVKPLVSTYWLPPQFTLRDVNGPVVTTGVNVGVDMAVNVDVNVNVDVDTGVYVFVAIDVHVYVFVAVDV